jgi:hypothetical protein
MDKLKTFDLLPQSTHYSNVRSNVTRSQWDKIRKEVYAESDHKCKWCRDTGFNQGRKHAVEAHELFHFDESTQTQTLTEIVALCPRCHSTQHIGLANIRGTIEDVFKHFMKVTRKTSVEAILILDKTTERFKVLNQIKEWKLDLTYLKKFNF